MTQTQTRRYTHIRLGRGGLDGLLDVGRDVINVLDADRDADEVRGDAGALELVRAQLLVRGAGRVDDQRLGVADIGEVAQQLLRGERAGEVSRGEAFFFF